MYISSFVRAFPAPANWREQDAATLAAAIVQPVMLKPMTLMGLFTAAAGAGADVAEFRAIWQYSEYVQRVEHALANGDLAGAQGLLAVCPVSFGGETMAALGFTLAANTLRLVDVVAAQTGEAVPETIKADDVTTALEAAGYLWDGSEWVRA